MIKHDVAAKSAQGKSGANQGVITGVGAENKTHSPDNNKRLAELEQGVSTLSLALQGFPTGQGEDAFAGSVRLLGELRHRQSVQANVDAQTASLVEFLLGRKDFTASAGESPAESMIRLVAGLEAEIRDGLSKLEILEANHAAELKRANEAEAQAATLAAQVDAVSSTIGAQVGFELREGELPSEGAARLIAEQAAKANDLEATLSQLQTDNHSLTEQLSAEQETRIAAEAKIETLSEGLKKRAAGEAEKALARAAGPAEPHPLELEEVETFSDLPKDGPLTLRFTDHGDLLALPGVRDVDRSAITLSGSQGLLDIAVDFPPDAPASRATTAWLIAGGKGCRCEISGGLRFGSGSVGQIPAGHLIF